MKVAYFIGSLNRGGTEMLTLDICRKLKSAPYDILLIYRNEGELSDEYRMTGVPMVRIKPHGAKISYFFQIKKVLKQEKIDVLHAQTLTNAMIAVVCTLFTRVKLVASFHGFYKSFLQKVERHLVMWKADALVFVSKYERDWYVKTTLFCPKRRCHVVYNGLNFDKFDISYPVPDFLRKAELTNLENCVNLAMVGNFGSVRSQNSLCRSLKCLIENGCNHFQFFFIGKRVEAESWLYDDCVRYCEVNHLSDYVHFLGSRGDVPAILQHIDAFVYSSDHDTFGIAVVEAVASGKPALVNDWVVMREVVGEKGWAELYRSNDEEDCSAKMKALIENIESRKLMAERAKQDVRESYSIENHIDKIYLVYESVFNKN